MWRSRGAIAWGVRNRVSFLNLGGDVEIVAETRFLGFWGFWVGSEKPGFLLNLVGMWRL